MGSGKFFILLVNSTEFQNLLKASIEMEKKILDFSGNFHDNAFLISRWLVIILENSYNQINTCLQ